MEPAEFLLKFYNKNMDIVGSNDFIKSKLSHKLTPYLDEILNRSESAKGVLTVVITSLVYKKFYPEQDIRNHQNGIKNGYSGRTFDTKIITPFLKNFKFPAMAESGWLTRSLEQKVPYNKDYPGAIRPDTLKKAFLITLDYIEKGMDCQEILSYILQGLIIIRNNQNIELAKPINLTIRKTISLLDNHFNNRYSSDGASRLPVLAIYSAYQCMLNEIKRFSRKILLPLESHTSADTRSGRIGDIEICDSSKRTYEAVEIKYGIPISLQIVKDAFEKFSTTQVTRYYLLSTSGISIDENNVIETEIEKIINVHGCHVIVNGVLQTINYYLRLITDPSDFIRNYVKLIENDKALKFEHKKHWNDLVSIY